MTSSATPSHAYRYGAEDFNHGRWERYFIDTHDRAQWCEGWMDQWDATVRKVVTELQYPERQYPLALLQGYRKQMAHHLARPPISP